MDPRLLLVLIIVVDAVLLLEILFFIFRRSVSNRLIQTAFEKNNDHFEAIRNTLVGKLISDFEAKLILFNVAEIKRDFPAMEALIKEFEGMDLKDRQKKQIYPKIFYYYIDKGRKEEADAYYKKLSAFNVYNNKKDIEMTYDAYVKGGHQYLDETLKGLPRTQRQDLPAKERLIAKMYENKGINAEARKYRNLADQHEAALKKSVRR